MLSQTTKTCFLISIGLLSSCMRGPTTPEKSEIAVPASANTQLQGNEGGNGGDVVLNHKKGAWFLTEFNEENPFSRDDESIRKIRTCIKVSRDFGVNTDAAKTLIEEVSKTWLQYLKRQNIFIHTDGKKFRPATKLYWEECSESTDLQILLGVLDTSVNEHLQYFVKPMGYAWQTKSDSLTGWGKGYIWIAPPYSQNASFPRWGSGLSTGADALAGQAQLRQILLHEFGHVIGNDHVPSTIMRADIISHIASDPEGLRWAKKYAEDYTYKNFPEGVIDGETKLLLSRVCYGKNENGDCINSVEARMLNQGSEYWPDPVAIELLFGRAEFKSIMLYLALSMRPDGTQYFDAQYLGFKGSSPIQKKIRIEISEDPLFSENESKLFLMLLGKSQFFLRSAGNDVLSGTFQIEDKTFPVLLQRASKNQAITKLWILMNGRRIRLN